MSSTGQQQPGLDTKRAKKEKEPVPEHNTDEKACDFYLTKKKRFCRIEKRPGSRYCHTHHAEQQQVAAANGDAIIDDPKGPRIPCPINPNHTIYAKDLKRHVKVCPDRRFDPKELPYYDLDVHFGRSDAWVLAERKADNNGSGGGGGGIPAGVLGPNPWKSAEELAKVVSEEAEEEKKEQGATAGDTNEEHMHALPTGEAKKQFSHRSLRPEKLEELKCLIESLYDKHVAPMLEKLPSVPAEEQESKPEETVAADVEGTRALEAANQNVSRKASKKHAPQHVAIIKEMEQLQVAPVNLLEILRTQAAAATHEKKMDAQQEGENKSFDYIEMGAGKGGLALALRENFHELIQNQRKDSRLAETDEKQQNTEGTNVGGGGEEEAFKKLADDVKFVVVDRGGFRRKADGAVRNEANAFVRLRLDIKDYHLGMSLPTIYPSCEKKQKTMETKTNGAEESATCEKKNMVAVGKHLCGACTDFALSTCTTALQQPTPALKQKGAKDTNESTAVPPPCDSFSMSAAVDNIVIATCCHHRCELRHLLPLADTPSSEANNYVSDPHHPFFGFTSSEFECVTSLTSWACCGKHAVSAEQRELGYKCKRLIDYCRLVHLYTNCGFDKKKCRLVEYVPREISGENVLLIAQR